MDLDAFLSSLKIAGQEFKRAIGKENYLIIDYLIQPSFYRRKKF